MYFSSDNWGGAHPRIAESLTRHASGFAAAYGTSEFDKRIEQKFNDIFERDVAVFFVGTGTAANSLSLAAVSRPGGVSFCHREAHMFADECGAPELFTHGARLAPVDGPGGKIDPDALRHEISRFPPEFVHAGQPMAVSLTQATEIGTVYTADEIDTIAAICREHDLPLHMDGARFANALVHLGVSPAEITWKRGIDMMSFGATKNGCWCAEALVVFDPSKAGQLPFIRKRAAQLFSKTRFLSAQFEAYFEDGLWLEIAEWANGHAAQLQEGIRASANARLAWRADANEVFAILKRRHADAIRQKGAQFHDWNPPHASGLKLADDEVLVRCVTSFATTPDHISQFLELLG
jgi:threonine aldolase